MITSVREPKDGTKAAARLEIRRRVLCAKHGCPPVVVTCFGQVTCARCGAIVGDTLMGSFDMSYVAVVDHDCEKCRAVWAAMTAQQQQLTPGRPSEGDIAP